MYMVKDSTCSYCSYYIVAAMEVCSLVEMAKTLADM